MWGYDVFSATGQGRCCGHRCRRTPVRLWGQRRPEQRQEIRRRSGRRHAADLARAVGAGSLVCRAAAAAAAKRAASVKVLGAVARNINVPWGIAFLSNGKALVSSRDRERILRVNPSTGKKKRIGTVPGVVSNGASGGEAGLLGLALSPKFATNHWLYAYMSTSSDNRVVRMRYRNGKLGKVHVLVKGIPVGLHHDGGRIAFGPDRKLYIATGEGGNGSLAQKQEVPGRQDPAGDCEGERAVVGQPVQGLAAGLQLWPPQRPGSRLGLGRAAVGDGVRRPCLGRAQPDQGRSQLRLAGDRGQARATPRTPAPRRSGTTTTPARRASPSSTTSRGSAGSPATGCFARSSTEHRWRRRRSSWSNAYGRLRTARRRRTARCG